MTRTQVTKHGTVLAASELKLETTQHEVPCQLYVRRSVDGGVTWGNSSVLVNNETNLGGGSFVYSNSTDTVDLTPI